jgi:CRP/FNR family nitrogen fixation transcriptional regulator
MQIALQTSAPALSMPPSHLRTVLPEAAARPALGTARTYLKGDSIFAQGDDADSFYKVLSGTVRTSQLLSDGRRQIDSFHLAGDVFGIEAGETHRFSADVVETATIVAYRRCRLDRLTAEDSDFTQQVVAAMMRSLERAQDHLLLLGRKSALEKIATFLLDMAARLPDLDHVDLPMSRIDIADHLGLTIETVSRSLTRLERDGVIRLPEHRRSIILYNKSALRRLTA